MRRCENCDVVSREGPSREGRAPARPRSRWSATLPGCALGLLILLAGGCRRTDVRDYTLSLPGLTEANKTLVVEALAKYNGVRKDSYVFDFQKKTLTLKYDSMQIAKTNIRMAIQDKGLEVK